MTKDSRKPLVNPIILLSYSLDMSGTFLPYLQRESKGIQQAIRHLSVSEGYKLELIQAETPEEIWSGFAQARGEILVYHYCGHASQDHLILEGSRNQKIKVVEFANFLRQQPKLKLVFLNACLTNSQSETLIAAGIPYLILTKREINDKMASAFAIEFYRSLGAFHTVERSFKEAKSILMSTHRGFVKEDDGRLTDDDFPWELYINSKESNWKLTPKVPSKKRIPAYLMAIILLVIISISSFFLPEKKELPTTTPIETGEILTDSSTQTKKKPENKPVENEANLARIQTQVSIVDSDNRMGLAGMKVEIQADNKIIHKTTTEMGKIELSLAQTMLGKRLRFTIVDPKHIYKHTVEDRYLNKGVIPTIELIKINQQQ